MGQRRERRRVVEATAGVLCLVTMVSGCGPVRGHKATAGTIIGGALGAAVGAVLAGEDDRVLGAVLGGLGGAGIGYLIGRELDSRDRASLGRKIEEVASNGLTNRPVEWQSDHSTASAVITPVGGMERSVETVGIQTVQGLVVSPSLRVYPGRSRIVSENEVTRLGPGWDYASDRLVRRGETMQVLGVASGGWVLVGDGKTAIGYLNERAFRDDNAFSRPPKQGKAAPEAQARTSPSVPGEGARPSTTGASEIDVRVVRDCRPVRIRVKTADGHVEENVVKTCRAADGSWGA